MLIFKGNKEVNEYEFRYNGKIKSVSVGDKVDVRDFDVANKDVKGAEKHIMSKHAGLFDLTEDNLENAVSKEAQKEIKDLKAALAEKDELLRQASEALKSISEKHSASAGEIESAKKEAVGSRKEVTRLKKALDDQEDEIKKLRLQIGSKKA